MLSEWSRLAVFRRLGDEIHPWLPNGDLRPDPDIRGNVRLDIEVHESSRSGRTTKLTGSF